MSLSKSSLTIVFSPGTEVKAKGSQDYIEILEEDEDEVSPLPKSSLGEWNSERKQVRILLPD